MPKKIVICFDGTCNHPKDAKQEREWFGYGDIEDNGITNVLKLHVLFGGDLRNSTKNGAQHSFYYSGVGTYGNYFQRMFNTAFAPDKLDVGKIIKKAGKDLFQSYDAGDEIFIFGFSRGAAIARRFASVIRDYIPRDKAPSDKPVRFIGVFDTVASIGLPNLDDDKKPVSDVIFKNGNVSGNVKEALHLVSIDENRIAFQPTLMGKDERITEIWFAGAHSDIGGGYWFDGLSDITLEYMLKELSERKLELDVLTVDSVDYTRLKSDDGEYRIDKDDIFIKPKVNAKSHPKDRWWPIAKTTLGVRDIRVNDQYDKPLDTEMPNVHYSAVERIKEVCDYRPRALKGIRHKVVGNGHEQVCSGVYDHIKV